MSGVANPMSVRPGDDVLLEEPPAEAPEEASGTALLRNGPSGPWQPRYFETSLRHNRFAVYKSHNEVYKAPLLTVRLDRINDVRQFEQSLAESTQGGTQPRRRFLFYVSSPRDRIEVACRSQLELRDWCEDIHATVNFARKLAGKPPLPPM
jgi:hypothetical protein